MAGSASAMFETRLVCPKYCQSKGVLLWSAEVSKFVQAIIPKVPIPKRLDSKPSRSVVMTSPPANFRPVLVLTKPAQCRPSMQPAPRLSLPISACALAEGRNHDVIGHGLDGFQWFRTIPLTAPSCLRSGITLTRRTIRRTMRSSRAGDRLCLGFKTQSSHSPWHVVFARVNFFHGWGGWIWRSGHIRRDLCTTGRFDEILRCFAETILVPNICKFVYTITI